MADLIKTQVPSAEEDRAELSALYQSCLDYMSITWEPDQSTERNIKQCMEEAMTYLRSKAGCPSLSFKTGENRSLFKICVWYLVENQRAEFEREYSGELVALRLREGFHCGQ